MFGLHNETMVSLARFSLFVQAWICNMVVAVGPVRSGISLFFGTFCCIEFLCQNEVPRENNLDVDVGGVEVLHNPNAVDQGCCCAIESSLGNFGLWNVVKPVVDVSFTVILETLGNFRTSDVNLGINAICWASSILTLGDSTPAQEALLSQSCDASFFRKRTKKTVTSKNEFGDVLVEVSWRVLISSLHYFKLQFKLAFLWWGLPDLRPG